MYVAIAHVDTGERVFTPGEIIEFDPNAEWHLKTGAIKRIAGNPAFCIPGAAGNDGANDGDDGEIEETGDTIDSGDGAADDGSNDDDADCEEPEPVVLNVEDAIVPPEKEKAAENKSSKGGRKK